jgi:hypothetical protein
MLVLCLTPSPQATPPFSFLHPKPPPQLFTSYPNSPSAYLRLRAPKIPLRLPLLKGNDPLCKKYCPPLQKGDLPYGISSK